MAEDPEYRLTSYPRVLAAILAGDWVFAQSQRSLRAVVTLMTSGAAFRQLLYGRSPRSNYGVSLALPTGSGREELLERCFEVIETASDGDIAMHACHMARENGSRSELFERWSEFYSKAKAGGDRLRSLYPAHWLGLLSRVMPSQLQEILGRDELPATGVMDILLSTRPSVDFLESDESRVKLVANQLLGGSASFIGFEVTGLRGLAGALTVLGYYPIFSGMHERMTLREARARTFSHRSATLENRRQSEAMTEVNNALAPLGSVYEELIGTWRASLRPWNDLVEGIRGVYGENWALQKLAVLASAVSERPDSPEDGVSLLDEELALCIRARLARLRGGNLGWWRGQLGQIQTPSQESFVVLMALHAAGPSTLVALSGDIDRLVNEWSADQYSRVLSGLREVVNVTALVDKSRRSVIPVHELPARLSARMISLLGRRASQATRAHLYERYLSRYSGNDKRVLEFCQEVMLDAVKRDSDAWFKFLDIVKRTYDVSEFTGPSHTIYVGWDEKWARNIPIEAARTIAQSDAEYPLDLVVLAQRKCQQALSEGIEALAVVAEREGWFEEGLE